MKIAVANDYNYSRTHKRQRLTLWLGDGTAATYIGEAFNRPKGWTLYLDLRVRTEVVRLDTEHADRTDTNFRALDKLIEEAVEKHYQSPNDLDPAHAGR